MINLLSPCHLTDILEGCHIIILIQQFFPEQFEDVSLLLPYIWFNLKYVSVFIFFFVCDISLFHTVFPFSFPHSVFSFVVFEIAMNFEYKSCRISTCDRLAKACNLDYSVSILGCTQTGLWKNVPLSSLLCLYCPCCGFRLGHMILLCRKLVFLAFAIHLLFIFESLLFFVIFQLKSQISLIYQLEF